MATTNQQIKDIALDRAAMVRLYEETLQQQLADIINEHNEGLQELIRNNSLTGASRTRLENRIRKQITRTYRNVHRSARRGLKDLIRAETDAGVMTLASRVRRFYSIEEPKINELLRSVDTAPLMGGVLGNEFNKIANGELVRARNAIRAGVSSGASNALIARQVGKSITGISRQQVQVLTRTGITQFTNEAQLAVYMNNADVLNGYQYLATLDARTTQICASLDKRVFKIDASSPRPPQHWNCRSTTVPVVKSFDELGLDRRNRKFKRAYFDNPTDAKRAALDGQVALDEDYGSWLLRQNNDVKIRHLGTQGAVNIFNEGRLNLSQFSSRGRLLSLSALLRLNARATLNLTDNLRAVKTICRSPCTKPNVSADGSIDEYDQFFTGEINQNPNALIDGPDAATLRTYTRDFLNVDATRIKNGNLGLAKYSGNSFDAKLDNITISKEFAEEVRLNPDSGLPFHPGLAPDDPILFGEALLSVDNSTILTSAQKKFVRRLANDISGNNLNVQTAALNGIRQVFENYKNNAVLTYTNGLRYRDWYKQSEVGFLRAVRRTFSRGPGSNTGGTIYEVAEAATVLRTRELTAIRNYHKGNPSFAVSNKEKIDDVVKQYNKSYRRQQAFNYNQEKYDVINEVDFDDILTDGSAFDADLVKDAIDGDPELFKQIVINNLTNPDGARVSIVAERIGQDLVRAFRLDPDFIDLDLPYQLGDRVLTHLREVGLINYRRAAGTFERATLDIRSNHLIGSATSKIDVEVQFSDVDLVNLRYDNFVLRQRQKQPVDASNKIVIGNGNIKVGNQTYTISAKSRGADFDLTESDISVGNYAANQVVEVDRQTSSILIKLSRAQNIRGPNGIEFPNQFKKYLLDGDSIIQNTDKLLTLEAAIGTKKKFPIQFQPTKRIQYVGNIGWNTTKFQRGTYVNPGVQVINRDTVQNYLDSVADDIGRAINPNARSLAERQAAFEGVRNSLDELGDLFVKYETAGARTSAEILRTISTSRKFSWINEIEPEEYSNILNKVLDLRKFRIQVQRTSGGIKFTNFRLSGNLPASFRYNTKVKKGIDLSSNGPQLNAALSGDRQGLIATGVLKELNDDEIKSLYRDAVRNLLSRGTFSASGKELTEAQLFKLFKNRHNAAVYGQGARSGKLGISDKLGDLFPDDLIIDFRPGSLDELISGLDDQIAVLRNSSSREARNRIESITEVRNSLKKVQARNLSQAELNQLYELDNLAVEDQIFKILGQHTNRRYWTNRDVERIFDAITEETEILIPSWGVVNRSQGELYATVARANVLENHGTKVQALIGDEIVEYDYSLKTKVKRTVVRDGRRTSQEIIQTHENILDIGTAYTSAGVNFTHSTDAWFAKRIYTKLGIDLDEARRLGLPDTIQGIATIFDNFYFNILDEAFVKAAIRDTFAELVRGNFLRKNIENLIRTKRLYGPNRDKILVPTSKVQASDSLKALNGEEIELENIVGDNNYGIREEVGNFTLLDPIEYYMDQGIIKSQAELDELANAILNDQIDIRNYTAAN